MPGSTKGPGAYAVLSGFQIPLHSSLEAWEYAILESLQGKKRDETTSMLSRSIQFTKVRWLSEWIKVLGAKSDGPSSIPGTHGPISHGRRRKLTSASLPLTSDLHTFTHTDTC